MSSGRKGRKSNWLEVGKKRKTYSMAWCEDIHLSTDNSSQLVHSFFADTPVLSPPVLTPVLSPSGLQFWDRPAVLSVLSPPVLTSLAHI